MLQDISSQSQDDERVKSRTRREDQERDAYNRELGTRLVIARKGIGIDALAMSKALGMPLNTYLKYERGDRQFPMHRVLQFCQLTGASPAFVVAGRLADDWRISAATRKVKRASSSRSAEAK
jgi:transcriptional regulator with XRE-family HTH domain